MQSLSCEKGACVLGKTVTQLVFMVLMDDCVNVYVNGQELCV